MKNRIFLVKKHENPSNVEQDGAISFRNVRDQYPSPQPNKPKDPNPQHQQHENLKSRKNVKILQYENVMVEICGNKGY